MKNTATHHSRSRPIRHAIGGAVAIGLCALVPALLSAWLHPQASQWTRPTEAGTISWANAQMLSKALWIDARSAEDFSRGHVPSALSLPPAEWDTRVEAVLIEWSPERPVVVYCGGNDCLASHSVAQRLREELGLTNVHVLSGGWSTAERAER